MNHQCLHCDCSFPDDSELCPTCREPNPLWEAKHRESTLIGYEAARPFEITGWIGFPKTL